MRGGSHNGSVCVMRWCDTYKGTELFTLGVNPLKRRNNRQVVSCTRKSLARTQG